jgi:hypothetical protein
MRIVGLPTKILTEVILSTGSTAVTEAPYLDLELICILRGHVTTYIISAL